MRAADGRIGDGGPATLPALPGDVRVRRARLSAGTLAIRTEVFGIDRVTVSAAVPVGAVAAVVRHLRLRHPRACMAESCPDGRTWAEGPVPCGPAPEPLRSAPVFAPVVAV